MWNSSIPAVALLMAPVTIAAGPVVAYNVALVLAIVTSGLAAWAASRRYVDGMLGPLVAGAVYAFSSYTIGHATLHLNLDVRVRAAADADPARRAGRAPTVEPGPDRRGDRCARVPSSCTCSRRSWPRWSWPPRSSHSWWSWLSGIGTRSGPGRGGWRRRRSRPPSRSCCSRPGRSPCSSWARVGSRVGSRTSRAFSTDLLNLVLPTPNTFLAPPPLTEFTRHFSTLYHEATAYIGVPLLLVLVVLVVTRWRDPRVRVGGLVALALFVLSLGPVLHLATEDTGIPMPWWPLAHLPLIEHAIPGRMTMYFFLAVAILVGIAIEQLQRMPVGRQGGRHRVHRARPRGRDATPVRGVEVADTRVVRGRRSRLAGSRRPGAVRAALREWRRRGTDAVDRRRGQPAADVAGLRLRPAGGRQPGVRARRPTT